LFLTMDLVSYYTSDCLRLDQAYESLGHCSNMMPGDLLRRFIGF